MSATARLADARFDRAAPDTSHASDRAVGRPIGWVRARLACVAATERQRRHRQRLRDGRIVLTLDADQRLIEALLTIGAISEAESLSRHAVEQALSEMIDDWSRRALSVTA